MFIFETLIWFAICNITSGFLNMNMKTFVPKKYALTNSRFMEEMKRLNTPLLETPNNGNKTQYEDNDVLNNLKKRYHLTSPRFLEQIRRLNNRNASINNNEYNQAEDTLQQNRMIVNKAKYLRSLGIIIKEEDISSLNGFNDYDYNDPNEPISNDGQADKYDRTLYNYNNYEPNAHKEKKSQNFEIVTNSGIDFSHIGGYDSVKSELHQCIDILKNYNKYSKYNVRIPKGLILEGPPGTGKTLLAKAFASEANCSFIAVSGADFQEKYVGVGPSRVKELFSLAQKNRPCIIFIDEIDAVGRKRSSDGESSSNERDNTLNALLVELDGFKNNSGIFLVAATNRVDLLDNALTRPGRIDKHIYIGLPDKNTRNAIIGIHIKGKPHDDSIKRDEMVELTEGLSGAQIENILNEALLNRLKHHYREKANGDILAKEQEPMFSNEDVNMVMNKMLAGWQPNEHEYSEDTVERIAIHEMGHAIVGYFTQFHSNVTKVVINLSSPKSPGYTIFQNTLSTLYTREALFERLMILLAGRIAEVLFYDVSVTIGAQRDIEEALHLAKLMIVQYGMGPSLVYSQESDAFREKIDIDVTNLLNDAYRYAEEIVIKNKEVISKGATVLKRDKLLTISQLEGLVINNDDNNIPCIDVSK
jgi:cell division protease FtsH